MRRLASLELIAGLCVVAVSTAACGPAGDDVAECSGILTGTLVISEVQADYAAPTGASGADSAHEWFEIYNSSSAPVELAGLTISHGKLDDPTPATHSMRAVTIGPGAYLVLGNVPSDILPAHVDYGYGNNLGDLFNSDAGKLALQCGDVTVDEAIYDTVAAGRSRTLDGDATPDYQANDAQTSWCDAPEDATAEYEPANFGTPGAANQACMNITPGTCMDGASSRPTVAPVVGDLTITEVMPDPSAVADTAGEWIEIRANRDVDLNDLGIAGASGNPVVLASSNCVRLAAGSYAVFARNPATMANGGLPPVTGSSVALANSNGTVRLLIGATELDSMSWTTVRAGKSVQLDGRLTAPTDNDVAANLCDGNAAYGAGDLGTPGAANRDCGGGPITGMCLDGAVMRPIVTPTTGQLLINEWMPDPSLVADAQGEWFELAATADVDLNGLQVGAATLNLTSVIPASGACVRIATGGFALIAKNATATANGMLPAVDAVTTTNLNNSNGTLQIGFAGVQLQAVTWIASSPGKSIMIDSDGTQCNAPTGLPLYNVMDTGTPRAINTPPECP